MKLPPWVIQIDENETDLRFGVRIRHIESFNDGDVPISMITHALVKGDQPMYAIDIGVDKGWWSLFVADSNPNIQIDSFEPNKKSYNVCLPFFQTVPNIRLHNIAISNKNGELPFVERGGDSHSRDLSGETTVPCCTLDEFIQGKHVDIMKIDTEGHELQIFQNLKNYLNQIDTIIFEFSPHWYGKTDEECRKNGFSLLLSLFKFYRFTILLTRRGFPEFIYIKSDSELKYYFEYLFNNKIQVDFVVSMKNIYFQ